MALAQCTAKCNVRFLGSGAGCEIGVSLQVEQWLPWVCVNGLGIFMWLLKLASVARV